MRDGHQRRYHRHLGQPSKGKLPRGMALPELGIDAFRSGCSILIDDPHMLGAHADTPRSDHKHRSMTFF